MKVGITGANGFLGKALVEEFIQANNQVTAIVRSKLSYKFSDNVSVLECEGINSNTSWGEQLKGLDVIVHAAARVHVLDETSNDPLEAFREVNTYGTVNLAEAAVASGVKRFIFISSIKVHGEENTNLVPFKEGEHLLPVDPYGVSKLEAEEKLLAIGATSDMEVVIVRPPLIYGKGVKANFKSMVSMVKKRLPFPLALVKTKRSLVALENLTDFIRCCSIHANAGGNAFLISDQQDLSVANLIKIMAEKAGVKVLMIPVPVSILKFIAIMTGKKATAVKLLGNLQVDISKANMLLNWKPKVTVEQAIKSVFEEE